jgi:ribosomal-protein-alanine N-acetyltransferase
MDSPSTTIRRLVYADLPEVIGIERQCFPTPWSLAMFVLELSKPAGICLALEDEDGLAGYLVCSRFEDVWHLMNVSVDPRRRRRGHAAALIGELLGELGEQARLTLEVRPSNASAIALYERYGFLSVGRRKSYYHDNGEDALIMWRTPATLRGSLDDVPAAGPVSLS